MNREIVVHKGMMCDVECAIWSLHIGMMLYRTVLGNIDASILFLEWNCTFFAAPQDKNSHLLSIDFLIVHNDPLHPECF